jgi:hypothetical protein
MPPFSDVNAAGSISQSSPAPIKVAVVLGSRLVPGWVYYLMGKLISCKAVELALVIVNNESKVSVGLERGPILFRLWSALDRWVHRHRTDALQLGNWGYLLKDRSIPVIELRTCNTIPSSEIDIAPIKAANCDLLLYLGSDAPGAEILACARLGTWSVQQRSLHGATEVPDQFWDMYEGNRLTLYGPQIVEQMQGRTRVVYRSSDTTSLLSLALNQNAAYWEVAHVLVSQLSNAARLRAGEQLGSEGNANRHEMSHTLTNLRMARFLGQWTVRVLHRELTKRLSREQWSIILQPKSVAPKMISDQGLRSLSPPRDRFYADPFLIEKDGRTYLFFEDYSFASRKGLISCCEVDREGNCSKPRVVLEKKYHLSYPFLFKWQGEIYMIPETRDNGTIEMYRATNFPYYWTHEAVLMSNVLATDSTLLHHRDKWWLFTAGVFDHAPPEKILCLFFADSPMGPWTAHPKNPIVSDVCHARPAGCLYFEDGQLIRPGQDCSESYGYAVRLHRVDVLSETDYQETHFASIPPDWLPGSRGIHTLNQNGEFRVIDCRFMIPRFNFASFSQFF